MLEPEPNLSPENNYTYLSHSIEVFDSESGTVFVFDGKKVFGHPGKVSACKKSLSETVCAFVDSSMALYVVTQKKCILVSDRVTYFAISPLGDAVYFFRESKKYENKSELFRFTVKNAYLSTIDISKYFVSPEKSVISSDGVAFIYYKNYGIGTSDTCYLSKNGNEGILTEISGYADSVSSDGRFVVWHDDLKHYYLRSNGTDKPINTDLPSTVKVNIRSDEVLYSVSSGGTYLIRNGGEAEKLSDETVYSVCYPENVLKTYGIVAMVHSFKMKLFTSSASLSATNRLCYITSRFDDRVYNGLSLSEGNFVSYNMNLIYTVGRDGVLIKINRSNYDMTDEKDNDVVPFSLVMSGDGKTVYYKKNDGSLWSFTNNSAKQINDAADVYFVSKNGNICFTSGKKLYCSSPDGLFYGSGSELSEDSELFASVQNVFLLSENTLFLLDGKGGFEVLAENITDRIITEG